MTGPTNPAVARIVAAFAGAAPADVAAAMQAAGYDPAELARLNRHPWATTTGNRWKVAERGLAGRWLAGDPAIRVVEVAVGRAGTVAVLNVYVPNPAVGPRPGGSPLDTMTAAASTRIPVPADDAAAYAAIDAALSAPIPTPEG